MSTPNQRSRVQATPGSGRQKSAVKTPKSVLTPNDDAAEKASMRRKRRSEALRLSLSDAFAGQTDQQQQQQPGGGSNQSSSARQMLSEDARNSLLEQCLKLATENKITDRNAWHLDLITHLPDIVSSGSLRSHSSGYNFQKMSGGLDAGVTIYSKRVDLTYKAAFESLRGCGPSKQAGDDDDDEGCAGEGDDEDIEDAAAAAAKAQKQKGRSKQQGEAADEAHTLTTPEHLRQKKGDTTFAVDPLFHTMSALFDEGGAKGLQLLNRSVFDSAHIMTSPHDVPEQQFNLQPAPQQDMLLDLKPLQQQLAACSSPTGAAAPAAAAGPGPLFTPSLHQLYELLEQTSKALPGHKQQQRQQADGGVSIASIMQQATKGLAPTPMARPVRTAACSSHTAAGPAAAAAAATGTGTGNCADTSSTGGSSDADMADACADTEPAAGSADDCVVSSSSSGGGGGSNAGEGPTAAGVPVVASFLASCAAADEEEEEAAAAAAAGNSFAEDYSADGGFGDDDHPGFGGDDEDAAAQELSTSWSQQQGEQRRMSMLGMGSEGLDGASVLDAAALQQLLGGATGSAGRKGTTMTGSGWAGSRFWKYRSAAAAAARMASGGGAAVKRAPAAAQGGSSRSAAYRIDFTSRPHDLSAALAQGSKRQTCLLTAPSSSTADTLLPEDLHYQASSLLQLFLRDTPISFARQLHQHQQGGGSGAAAGSLPSWAEEGGGDGEGCWGDDGYGDDDDDGDAGADGYNAGDLSMGDPGFSHSHHEGASDSAGDAHWWSAEGELLSAPKRSMARAVNYTRSAKQVDVRALKDILWDSLVCVNHQHNSTASSSTPPPSPAAGAAAAAGPVIPFQDVIVRVPEDSAAGPLQDVSVHMCFICLLHLANEKGLVVEAHEDLTTVTISNIQQQEQQPQ